MRQFLKPLASLALEVPGFARVVRWHKQVGLVVLCFHRFAGPLNAAGGDDLDAIDDSLRWLRRAGFTFAELESTVRVLVGGRALDRPTVVVTIDDGYADLLPAVPVFARHGCPVSVFLATQFLDSRSPLWWDQVQLLLAKAPGTARLEGVAGISWAAQWTTAAERFRQGEALIEIIKREREPARHAVIAALAAAVGAPIPFPETPGYAPLLWDEVRDLEREGARFGPHTHTHPILSAVDDAQAKVEIDTSWARVQDEVKNPLPIFAYPNGTEWSYTARDGALLRQAGIDAAVSLDARCTHPSLPLRDAYAISRLSFQLDFPGFQRSVLRL